MESKNTFGSFFSGVLSTIVGIGILGLFAGGVIWVARKIAGPAEYIVVDPKTK